MGAEKKITDGRPYRRLPHSELVLREEKTKIDDRGQEAYVLPRQSYLSLRDVRRDYQDGVKKKGLKRDYQTLHGEFPTR